MRQVLRDTLRDGRLVYHKSTVGPNNRDRRAEEKRLAQEPARLRKQKEKKKQARAK